MIINRFFSSLINLREEIERNYFFGSILRVTGLNAGR